MSRTMQQILNEERGRNIERGEHVLMRHFPNLNGMIFPCGVWGPVDDDKMSLAFRVLHWNQKGRAMIRGFAVPPMLEEWPHSDTYQSPLNDGTLHVHHSEYATKLLSMIQLEQKETAELMSASEQTHFAELKEYASQLHKLTLGISGAHERVKEELDLLMGRICEEFSDHFESPSPASKLVFPVSTSHVEKRKYEKRHASIGEVPKSKKKK